MSRTYTDTVENRKNDPEKLTQTFIESRRNNLPGVSVHAFAAFVHFYISKDDTGNFSGARNQAILKWLEKKDIGKNVKWGAWRAAIDWAFLLECHCDGRVITDHSMVVKYETGMQVLFAIQAKVLSLWPNGYIFPGPLFPPPDEDLANQIKSTWENVRKNE